jgi:hypothetical protein
MRHRLILGLLLAPCASAAAQVGYLPSQSPFRELTTGSLFEFNGGYVFGTGGLLQLGPRNGTSEGVRFVLRSNHTLQLSLGMWTAGMQRTWIDAYDSVATRNKGLTPQRLIAGEFGVQFNATGGKTWHGLAPHAGIGVGLVHGQASPAKDTSGYSFGTKFFFAPTLGTRLFAGQRLYLKLDVRGIFWNLVYPASYSNEPTKQPGTTGHSNAVNTTGATSQYTVTPEIRLGIGIHW